MVNLYSLVNDPSKKVIFLLDKNLLDAPWASFHPMDNHASTCVNKEGILKFKQLLGRDDESFQIIDFAEKLASGGAAPAQAPKDKAPK